MKENKKQVAKISIFITSIFVIFLSVTYAFINQTLTGERRQVITAGSLSVELVEDNEINITGAMPMYDEVGMIQDSFDFRIINHGAEKVNYILKLVDITTGDATNKLDPSIVKYGLTKDGGDTIKYVSNIIGNSLDKGTINGNETTIEYSLRLWIDAGVVNEDLIKDKSLKFKIDVEVTQSKQFAKYDAMMRASGSYIDEETEEPHLATDQYYAYSNQITSIVFEPKIDIPEGVESWDISKEANSGQVMAYVEEDGKCTLLEDGTEATAYRLHIQAKNGIAANEDSSLLFAMFTNLISIDGLEYFDTSKVTNMNSMFAACSSLTSLDLKNFDTSNVTDMNYMFGGCSSLTSLDVSNFDTSNVTNMQQMFSFCLNLTNLDLSSFDTSIVTNMTSMFVDCGNLTSLDVTGFDTSKVTTMSSMFEGCSSLTDLDVSNFDTSSVTYMRSMFYRCSSLKSLDVSKFNTSNVEDMDSMFSNCSSLTSLDVSNFDTLKVTNMAAMFNGCSSLTSLNLSDFDTSNVTNMYIMFSGCESLTSLNLSNLDTSNVTKMGGMFQKCSGLTTLDLSGFDTYNVIDMGYMFSGCSSLTNLDLSNFNTSKVTDMYGMFLNCSSLTSLDLSNFDISKVTDKSSMFGSVPTSSLITVKDDAMKTWVLGVRSDLTNVQVKSA